MEVKTIKNRKSIRIYTFAFALILTVLLSSIIGITVGKKPDRPGKPIETWDVKIWIEEPGTDIVLLSPIHEGEDPPIYLLVEDVPCSGGLWDLPMKKGKKPNTNNYLYASLDLVADFGDECGNYQLANVLGENSDGDPVWLGNFKLEMYDVDWVSISHRVWPMGEGEDFWTFEIRWFDPNPENPMFYMLEVWTNKDYELEGTLSDEDGWLIPFDGANLENAMLFSDWTDNDNNGVPDTIDWMGSLCFTVRVTRTPNQS